MKKIYLALLICAVTQISRAQFVTQSASGKGTVILPLNGVSLGFDIGKTEIAVGANNYSKALIKNNDQLFKNWFFGGNLSVKNSSGIGNLVKSGDLVPEGNLLGFMGFNINNHQRLIDEWKASSVNKLAYLQQDRRKKLVKKYAQAIIDIIETSGDEINDVDFRTATLAKWIKKVNAAKDGYALSRVILDLKKEGGAKLEPFVAMSKDLQTIKEKEYQASLAKTDMTKEMDAAFSEFTATHHILRLTPFIFGGLEARSFSLYSGPSTVSLAKSFEDKLYRNNQVGIGINGQVGSFWVGITYAWIDGDNFSGLSSKEYTLQTKDTLHNQTLIAEKKITGYSGKYARVKSNQLNIDLVKEFRLGDTSRLITNVYYRGTIASRDTTALKNISGIGLGLYFLGNKGKFLGGLYVELPDIGNQAEKAKPIADQNIRPPLRRLTFGVVTKFSLSSIFGFTDRPKKPEE
ncbi:MAG: hypothetical protein JKY70_22505 [Mucilaginibacter sp.]|nr:hypothetical protein [Mucilaginibacter sp.]